MVFVPSKLYTIFILELLASNAVAVALRASLRESAAYTFKVVAGAVAVGDAAEVVGLAVGLLEVHPAIRTETSTRINANPIYTDFLLYILTSRIEIYIVSVNY
jgi:hypothetical protein